MFKGIYNVYSKNLQYSAVKIISKMSKNRAHQSYLILKMADFANFAFAVGLCICGLVEQYACDLLA